MARKTKMVLLLVFLILLFGACFILWKDTAFAPHQIIIQNSSDEVIFETEALEENLEVTNTPSEEVPVEEITKPTTNILPTEKILAPSTDGPISPKDEPTKNPDFKIIQKLVSWGFSPASNRKIDTVIIHSSYNALGGDEYDVAKLIAEYKEYEVAPHYLIDRQGKIYQLVAEKNIAYHAGESKTPDGRTQVNSFSLGIEVINTKEDKYTSEQYASLNFLLAKIKANYSIKYVLGHNDISPGRKTDPWNFDWKKIK